MKNRYSLLLALLLISSILYGKIRSESAPLYNQHQNDSSRIAELDRYWERLNKTVMEGDFEGNKNCFHKDAVVIFASGQNKISVPIASALAGWKESFKMTKEGKIKVEIELRFSQRIGDATTAYETGIFIYRAINTTTQVSNEYFMPFEMLLVKRNNKWYAMMEHQKPLATQEEWDALK